jgi:hypothetical protein
MSERNQPMPLPEMAANTEDKHLIADMIPIWLTMVQKSRFAEAMMPAIFSKLVRSKRNPGRQGTFAGIASYSLAR